MERKKLLLDVDEVICFSGFLEAVNDFMDTNYEIDDFTDYYIDEVVIPKDRFDEFNRFVNNRNLYENVHILPGAIDTIKRLNEEYDIYICSSCVNDFDVNGSGRIFADKYNFLIRTLPFLNPKKFIFTSVKNMFKADIQIDDRIANFDTDIETKILFPSYHNKDVLDDELLEKGILRVGYDWRSGWQEIETLLNSKEFNSGKQKNLKNKKNSINFF